VDGFIVIENDDVVDYVRSCNVGDQVAFTVYRDGEYITVPVTIGDMNQFSN
jgi:S1-C subfamily serine protease